METVAMRNSALDAFGLQAIIAVGKQITIQRQHVRVIPVDLRLLVLVRNIPAEDTTIFDKSDDITGVVPKPCSGNRSYLNADCNADFFAVPSNVYWLYPSPIEVQHHSSG